MVVRREKLALSTGLITRTAQSVLFVLPWGEHWLVGTTDTDWEYSKSRPLATVEDVDYLLAQVNTVAAKPLGRADVEAVFAGLRPLVAGAGVVRGPGERAGARSGSQTAHLSREHAIGRPSPGLVVVSGGKFTTYRVVAADAVDAVISDQSSEAAPSKAAPATEGGSRTDRVPLLGADGFAACWDRRDQLSQEKRLPVTEVERLLAPVWQPGGRSAGHGGGARHCSSRCRVQQRTWEQRSGTQSPMKGRATSTTSCLAAHG